MARAAKKTYKITNWAKYNESLVKRGDITFWFSDETIRQWEHPNDRTKVGHPFVYSDTAIETMLALRELFRLSYRQTEGLGRALIQLMQVDGRQHRFESLRRRRMENADARQEQATHVAETALGHQPGNPGDHC